MAVGVSVKADVAVGDGVGDVVAVGVGVPMGVDVGEGVDVGISVVGWGGCVGASVGGAVSIGTDVGVATGERDGGVIDVCGGGVSGVVVDVASDARSSPAVSSISVEGGAVGVELRPSVLASVDFTVSVLGGLGVRLGADSARRRLSLPQK